MANQIAANLAARGEETAIAETAEHIRLYWDPRMKAGIRAAPEGLSPIARAALQRLVEQQEPQ
ncbi:MAG: formate dehydrogenase subunit delta [Sphingomonadales bacterium]|nr:formate dehydrogenase subunit delta [Sphingomonadales bacterium]